MKIYLSAPLFTQLERRWNRMLAAALEGSIAGAEVILPQDFRVGVKFNDRKQFRKLFYQCQQALRSSDAILAILDGADADSGVSFEIGCAQALGIPVIGLRTDYRQQQEKGVNFMVSQACSEYVLDLAFMENPSALVAKVARKLTGTIKKD